MKKLILHGQLSHYSSSSPISTVILSISYARYFIGNFDSNFETKNLLSMIFFFFFQFTSGSFPRSSELIFVIEISKQFCSYLETTNTTSCWESVPICALISSNFLKSRVSLFNSKLQVFCENRNCYLSLCYKFMHSANRNPKFMLKPENCQDKFCTAHCLLFSMLLKGEEYIQSLCLCLWVFSSKLGSLK